MSYNEIHVSSPSKSDLEQMHSIQKATFGQDALPKEYIESLINNGLLSLKIEIDDEEAKLAGFALIHMQDSDLLNKNVFTKAYIMNFIISPQYRHKGHGSHLLNIALNILKEKENYSVVALHVKTHNKNAIKFYEIFKFKILSEQIKYYSSGDDAYYMELELNSIGKT